jgi:hypothetical protein
MSFLILHHIVLDNRLIHAFCTRQKFSGTFLTKITVLPCLVITVNGEFLVIRLTGNQFLYV